jgi:tRNA modification GTPase
VIRSETIAAIATPLGEGGVGIVRISGQEAIEIAARVFQSKQGAELSLQRANTFTYGIIHDVDGEMVDMGIALVMRGPHSFTGEDTVELQGHGGTTILRRVLRCVIEAGATLAEPGEFSRRSFLNGRMDLTQAEGLYDLISARSDRAAKAALEQLEGSLSRSIHTLYDHFLEVTANLETTLDFVEDELPDDVFSGIRQKLDRSFKTLDALLKTWNEGRLLREGARVTILGRPNAGKSTLLNVLLGYERAIVSNVEGTTRDTIEEQWLLEGIPLRLTDTAGLRQTDCGIEAEGIRRAQRQADSAEIILYLIDSSQPLSQEDQQRLTALPKDRTIILLNKQDKGSVIHDLDGVAVSLKQKESLERIKAAIRQKLALTADSPAHAVISERHRALLVKACEEAKAARTLLNEHIEQQASLACDHLRSALEYLGQVTGRTYHEELLDNIFSRFCIGK